MGNSGNFWFGPQTNTPVTGQHNINVVRGKLGVSVRLIQNLIQSGVL
jgi:hypothetical protein